MTASIRAFFVSLMITGALLTSFGAGVLVDRLWLQPVPASAGVRVTSLASDTAQPAPPETDELAVFHDVWKMIQEQYYFQPVDRAKVLHAATKAMVQALGDDHSLFLTPQENEASRGQMQGHFDGIGVWVSTEDDVLRIIAPMDGSPAQRVGIEPNDIIRQIDGRDVSSMKTDEALALVRGKVGTTVRLALERAGATELIEVEVERARIEVDAVTSQVLDGDIGYVRVSVFGDKTTEQLDKALASMEERNVKGIILDLRNNGGGWLVSSREMLGRFLGDGPALIERSRNGDQIDTVITSTTVRVYETPLVVLVNGGTASASEIVAGALQDRQRATIVGERTYGKGSIQTVRELSDGSSARLTTSLWLTPNEHTIHKQGITPDIVVGPEGELVDDVLRPWLARPRTPRALGPTNPDGLTGPPDRQLERAINLLLHGK